MDLWPKRPILAHLLIELSFGVRSVLSFLINFLLKL
jgi:hypothetical protein